MLDIVNGDIWQFHPSNWICITTNLGWNRNGNAVMGAGIAKQAADRYPELLGWYGQKCRYKVPFDEMVDLYHQRKLIMLPTKSLNTEKPWLSLKGKSSLAFIDASLRSLVCSITELNAGARSIDSVYLPPPGCGNGGLKLESVMPLLEERLALSAVQFHLVVK